MSKRDKTNKLHWDELAIKTLNFMTESDINYLSIIRFEKDPSDVSAKKCLSYTIDLLKEQKEGVFKHKLGFSVELKKIAENDEILTSSFTEDFKREEYFESEYVSFQSNEEGISKNSLIKNPKIICFKSKELPDRVNSVIRTIRKAKKQLRSDLPGIIYIEINPNNFQPHDFDILERKIKEHFSDSINAVVLTKAPDIKINDEFGQYTHKSQVILNEKCKLTLPEKFEIIGTSKNKASN